MTGFMTLEMRRALKDVRYLILAVAMPIGLYLLFTGLFGSHGQRAQGLPQPTELMVAMIAYGAMWAVFSATGPRIAYERANGWTRQLRVTPLIPVAALAAPTTPVKPRRTAVVRAPRLDRPWVAQRGVGRGILGLPPCCPASLHDTPEHHRPGAYTHAHDLPVVARLDHQGQR